MQFKKKTGGKKSALINLLVIGALALIAIVLIVGWQAGWFRSGREDLSQEDIAGLRESLSTPDPIPTVTQPTATPSSSPAPVPAESAMPDPSPDPTAAPRETAEAEPEAYLFILINGRVTGIEPLGEERDVTVDQGSGVVNVIHLLPDGFYVQSSTCDNQLCVTEGTVTTENYPYRFLGTHVYCLPHNLDLQLVVPSATPDPNAPDI